MFRKITNIEYLDPEAVEIFINDGYVQGLQDVKDALIELYEHIKYFSNIDKDGILDALANFLIKLQTDIRLYRNDILDNTLFETMGFIRSLSSPKKEEKKAHGHSKKIIEKVFSGESRHSGKSQAGGPGSGGQGFRVSLVAPLAAGDGRGGYYSPHKKKLLYSGRGRRHAHRASGACQERLRVCDTR